MPVATFAMHRTDLPNLIVRYFFIYSGYEKTERKKRNDNNNNSTLFLSSSKVEESWNALLGIKAHQKFCRLEN